MIRLPLAPRNAPDPVSIRRDLSTDYAQLAVVPDGAGRPVLWIESATVDMWLRLSPAQVALLARSAVSAALLPVDEANIEQCLRPAVEERDPAPLDGAYRAIITALEAYQGAVERDRARREVGRESAS